MIYYPYGAPFYRLGIHNNGERVIHLFLNSMDHSRIVGSGGGGVVYINDALPEYVVKISSQDNRCRSWDKENEKLDGIRNNLQGSHIVEASLTKINLSLGFLKTEDPTRCAILLRRIYSPENTPYMVHPLFGEENAHYFSEGRGLFLGLKELKEKYTLELFQYVAQLGREMSILHYVAKNDGYDIEVILGHEFNKPQPLKLFIIDFDLSQMITQYDQGTIKRMVRGLESVPYFPTGGELFQIFQEAYLALARSVGMEDVARQVMRKYFDMVTY